MCNHAANHDAVRYGSYNSPRPPYVRSSQLPWCQSLGSQVSSSCHKCPDLQPHRKSRRCQVDLLVCLRPQFCTVCIDGSLTVLQLLALINWQPSQQLLPFLLWCAITPPTRMLSGTDPWQSKITVVYVTSHGLDWLPFKFTALAVSTGTQAMVQASRRASCAMQAADWRPAQATVASVSVTSVSVTSVSMA